MGDRGGERVAQTGEILDDVVVQRLGQLAALGERRRPRLVQQAAPVGARVPQPAGQVQGQREVEQRADQHDDHERHLQDEPPLRFRELRAGNRGLEEVALAVRAPEPRMNQHLLFREVGPEEGVLGVEQRQLGLAAAGQQRALRVSAEQWQALPHESGLVGEDDPAGAVPDPHCRHASVGHPRTDDIVELLVRSGVACHEIVGDQGGDGSVGERRRRRLSVLHGLLSRDDRAVSR